MFTRTVVVENVRPFDAQAEIYHVSFMADYQDGVYVPALQMGVVMPLETVVSEGFAIGKKYTMSLEEVAE